MSHYLGPILTEPDIFSMAQQHFVSEGGSQREKLYLYLNVLFFDKSVQTFVQEQIDPAGEVSYREVLYRGSHSKGIFPYFGHKNVNFRLF